VVRADDTRPILMLTARAELDARIAGLDAGADDRLAEPFELEEPLARFLRCCGEHRPNRPAPTGRYPVEGFAPLTPKADAWTPTASIAIPP